MSILEMGPRSLALFAVAMERDSHHPDSTGGPAAPRAGEGGEVR